MHHPKALQLVVAALPDAALRPLLLELLQNGATPTAPVASADVRPPADAASTTTPTTRAQHPGGRPKGSRNKTTGAAKAAMLAAQPGREEMVADVAAGKITQAEAARRLNTTPKTVGSWVERFRRGKPKPATASAADQTTTAPSRPPGPVGETPEQRTVRLARHAAAQRARDAEKRRARAAQLPMPNGSDGAARVAVSAAQPAPAKPGGSIVADAALAPALWAKAAERQPTAPWKSICEEFGIPIVTAMEHCRARTMPPIAPAAAARYLEMAAS
jgi:transposase-like protein